MYRKLIAVAALLAMPAAHGDETMRCGRWLVDSSATVEELLKKCGNPDSMRNEESDLRAMGPNGGMVKIGTAVTQYWTYDRGTQAAPIIVILKNGKIHSIKRDES